MTIMSWVLLCTAAPLIPLFAIRVYLARAHPRFAIAHGVLGIGCFIALLPQQLHQDFFSVPVALFGALTLLGGTCLLMKITTGGWVAQLLDSIILSCSISLVVTSTGVINSGIQITGAFQEHVLVTWAIFTGCVMLARFALAPHDMIRRERVLLCAASATAYLSQTTLSAGQWTNPEMMRIAGQVQLLLAIGFLAAYLISRARSEHGISPYSVKVPLPHIWWYSVGILGAIITNYGNRMGLIQVSWITIVFMYGIFLGIIFRLGAALSDIRRLEKSAKKHAAYYESLVSQSSDVTLVADTDGIITYASSPLGQLTTDELVGKHLAVAIGADAETTEQQVLHVLRFGKRRGLDSKNGDFAFETVISLFDGLVIANVRDVTERNDMREALHRMAFVDDATSLPNRHKATSAIAEQLKRDATMCSVVMMDVNMFKQVNDSGGHAMGDEVLRAIGERLSSTIGDDVELARLGGDEFLAIVNHEEHSPSDIAARMVDAMSMPFTAENHTFQLGAAVGVSHADSECDAEELLRRADIAMYSAKRNKRSVVTYHEGLSREATSNIERDADIAAAIRERRFELHLQPVIDMSDGSLLGAEALIRWVDAHGTVQGPWHLLDFARRTGQLRQITDWVISEAASILAHLPSLPRLSINIPPADLLDPTLPERLNAPLSALNIAPHRLVVEITEDELISTAHKKNSIMSSLQDAGFRVLIDDFGAGFSSLGNISDLPITGFKLDRSFVLSLHNNPRARTIVKALATVARENDLSLIVEGVETVEDHRVLHDLGCTQAQGFFYGEPQPFLGHVAELALSAWTKRTAGSLSVVLDEFAVNHH